MCGICGIINHDHDEPIERSLLERMTSTLAHRGPDNHRTRVHGHAGLGHRRLAIIDLSPDANQPMSNEDGSLQLVCNGEIYNYRELRRALIDKGHRFRSSGDAEVILHLYEEHGDDCVEHLRGMFAFAIWDRALDKLLLARDRLGQKPLYYASSQRRFLFASELKALLQDHTLGARVNPGALHHYLSLSYVPGPETALSDVYQLPAAHRLVRIGGRQRVERYWRLSFATAGAGPVDPRRAVRELTERLREAVALRLVSDVPLGAFLSGGIDSSAVVVAMSRLAKRPIKTFTVRFDEQSHDESAYARAVARQIGSEHHEHRVTPDVVSALPEIARSYDQPFGDPSAVPTYYLCRVAREHITVFLNGDGGDECFAGYDRYVKNKLAGYYYGLPAAIRTGLRGALGRVPEWMPQDGLPRRLRDFCRAEPQPLDQLYSRWLLSFDQAQKRGLYTADFARAVRGPETEEVIGRLLRSSDGDDITEAAQHADLLTYLPDDLLVKMDRAAMAHSIENRSPFLDHKLVEYAAGLPSHLKLRGVITKWILKKAMLDVLPRKVVLRPKRGFGIPVDRWLRCDLKEMCYDTLLSLGAVSRGYFKRAAVQELLDQHMTGRQNWQFQIWNLLLLELWHRSYIDGARGELLA